jgi:hypothetical protein
MTATPRTCVTIACNVCNEPFGDGNGITWHCDSIRDAQSVSEDHDWVILDDGTAICPDWKADHDEFAKSLRPNIAPPEWDQITRQRLNLDDDIDTVPVQYAEKTGV